MMHIFVLAGLTVASYGGTIFLFREGGIYNPKPMPSLDHITEIELSSTVKSDLIYHEAVACLDTHVTLNPAIPPDVGCAEACSYILQHAGMAIPPGGFAGTAALWEWLKTAAVEVKTPQAGDIVISPTGTGTRPNIAPHGHVGIVLKHGIASNDSNTGLFRENYTLLGWPRLFTGLGYPTYYYHFS